MKIKYDISLMQFMSMFQYITRCALKDCFVDEVFGLLTFVVQPGEMGKALGKGAVHVKKIEQKLKRKIRVVEFHPDITRFIQNIILPLRVDSITEEQNELGVVVISSRDTKVKSLLIGRNAVNLRNLENNCRRYFPELKEVRVV